jgi:hypothetical protein
LGDDHAPVHPPRAGPVDAGGLELVVRNAPQRGEIHHHAVATELPDKCEDHRREHDVRVADPVVRAEPEQPDEGVHDPVVHVVHPEPELARDNEGKRHRQQVDRPERALESDLAVEQDRDPEAGDETDEREPDQEGKRVPAGGDDRRRGERLDVHLDIEVGVLGGGEPGVVGERDDEVPPDRTVDEQRDHRERN